MSAGERVGPTKERLAKAGEDVEDFIAKEDAQTVSEQVLTVRLLDGSVLDMLLSRGSITGDQYHAGGQLYADWYYSGLALGAIDPLIDRVDNAVATGDADRQLDAMTRYRQAIAAVGMVHAHVLTAVVLLEESLGGYGLRRFEIKDWFYARKLTIAVLKAALDQLDYHYYGKRKGIYRHGHATDYRPAIQDHEPEA